LKFYADEEARRSWRKEWPDDVVPEPEIPPYDRDRHLPEFEFKDDDSVM
jgi:hypothetical protein